MNLLYQWNFDGTNPGAPNVSAGGGTLAVTNSTNGGIAFSGTGGVTGGALDLTHNQQFGTLDPTGYASSDSTGNALTGLGTQNQITVSMWVKANSAGNALSASSLPRILELADIPNYDEDNNNPPPQTGQNNNGVTIQLNANKNYSMYTRGVNNSTSNLGQTLTPDQWTLVVLTEDLNYDGTNNNPYFDPKMATATGSQFTGNEVLYNATQTAIPAGASGSATDNKFDPSQSPTNAYPGPINFGSAAQLYLGNRGAGTPANPNPQSGDTGGDTQGFNGMIDNVRIFSGLAGPTDVEKIRRADLGLATNFSSQWTKAGDGNWTDGTNWSPGVPFITDDSATLGSQGGSGPHNVTLNSAAQVGTLTFGDASNPSGNYTIGGTGKMVLSNTDAGSLATISVLSGNQTINAQVVAGTFGVSSPSPVFNVATGASLTVNSFVTFNAGPVNGVSKQGGGKLTMKPFTFGNLRVEGGTFAMTPGSTAGGAFFKPYSLTILAGAALDITNNNFVSAGGDTNPDNIRTQIAAAYANGSWTGTSTTSAAITSANGAAVAADPNNHNKTGVGYAVAQTLSSAWIGGPNPGGTSILLSYTLLGDADINGTVDTSDFTAMSQNFGQTSSTWVNGDFNYDGVVNALDFNLLATNFGASFSQSAPALGSVVPEPATLFAVMLVPVLLSGRRRNRRSY